MDRPYPTHWTARSGWRLSWLGILLGFFAAALGCDSHDSAVRPTESPKQAVLAKKTKLGKNVWFQAPEAGPRRVIISAVVCMREGQIEGFLTRKGAKEYEYILAADVDAYEIHKALMAAGAEPGSPVNFGPDGKYTPASGANIKVSIQYKAKDGSTITQPAQSWIRHAVTKKPLEASWVFGGSVLIPDPDDAKKPKFYAANEGDLICVYNMPHAMLDLSVRNPNVDPESRVYEVNSDKIPPIGTRVEVVLEAVGGKPAANDPPGEKKAPEQNQGAGPDSQGSDKK